MKLSHIFKDLLNEDFKTQTQKFVSQGYDLEIVRNYIEKFKYIRDGKYREAYTSVIHKQDNSTYNGYMFIKDIPSYFKNYKLFEVLKIFKKLIK
jgi:hypothetical protein